MHNKPKQLIAIGTNEFIKEVVNTRVHKKRGYNKPPTGFWCAPYLGEKEISSWYQMIRNGRVSRFYDNDSVILTIKEDAKWCIIDSKKDLEKLFNEVGYRYYDFELFKSMFDREIVTIVDNNLNLEDFYKGLRTVNWNTLKTKCDIVYLTAEGYEDTDYFENIKDINNINNKEYENTLYGWNCECCVILNADAVESWEYKKIDMLGEL